MKNQKGVTLMILVSTVICMALIFGAISYNSISSYKLNSYYLMRADIELLDEKIALYYLQNNKQLPITNEYVEITDLIPDYGTTNVNYNPNNNGKLYKIDLNHLENLSLKNSVYYIDQQSHTIYASKGQKLEDAVYYTIPTDYTKVELTNYY